MAGYTKLFGSIVHSTIWRESADTKVVWVTMLALADQHGEVMASIPGLADVARVSLQSCEDALGKFEAPDPYSRTPDNEGRRIQKIPGGWVILNYSLYRLMESEAHRREMDAARQKRYREGKKSNTQSPSVTPCHASSLQAEAEAEAEAERTTTTTPSPSAAVYHVPAVARKPKRSFKGPKLTDLRPGSESAFDATWEDWTRKAVRFDERSQHYQDVDINRGSRAQAERNFQSIISAGLATPRELYACSYLYLKSDMPKKGYIQAPSTFYGPEKATWRDFLPDARAAIAKQDEEESS